MEIPIPEHLQAVRLDNVNMRDESSKAGVLIKCHRQILIAQSAYFRGLIEFNSISQSS